MNASKENARRARNALEQLVVAYNTSKIEVVRRFLIAAEARLPTEQAEVQVAAALEQSRRNTGIYALLGTELWFASLSGATTLTQRRHPDVGKDVD